MSFNLDIDPILQYGYNIFASSAQLIYLFVGVTLGLTLIGGLIKIFSKG